MIGKLVQINELNEKKNDFQKPHTTTNADFSQRFDEEKVYFKLKNDLQKHSSQSQHS